jgi:hypothetical protein
MLVRRDAEFYRLKNGRDSGEVTGHGVIGPLFLQLTCSLLCCPDSAGLGNPVGWHTSHGTPNKIIKNVSC